MESFKDVISEKEFQELPADVKAKITKLRDSIFDLQTDFQKLKTDFDYKYYLKQMRNMAVKINNEAQG